MRKFFILLSFTFLLNYLQAQITVTDNDFANAGDAVIMSNATINQLLNYQSTGANSTWDFSTLQYSSQYVDNFMNEYSALQYALYFADASFNSHRANIAQNGSSPAPLLPLLPLTITNAVNFYYKSSSQYVQPGFGADVNSIPLPIGYNHNDVIYNFPLQFDNTDASSSGYSINLPGSGYYGYQQTRTNTVDGWGTLTTPYGTFPVLRVLSQITSDDTFYINGLNFGFKIPRITQKEYKWIANGEKEPVLQVNTDVLISGIIEDVTSIVYRDSLHPTIVVVSAINGPTSNSFNFNLYPNPARNQFTILATSAIEHADMVISDITGRTVISKELQGNEETIETSTWERGVYLVAINKSGERVVRRVVVE
jgi:hypothetical protein